MSANRSTLGLAVLVTVVVVLSSMGLAGWGSAAHAAPSATSAASPAAIPHLPISSPATASAPAVLTTNGPTTPATPSSPTALPTPSGRMSSLVSELRAQHVPLKYAFLPNLNANPNPSLVNGHVNPTYSSAPAPLGVAEYGLRNVSGTITPYTLSTPSVEGTYGPYAMSGLSQDISGPDEYGVQLNSVLNNVTLQGTTGYEFWTQNVIEYSTFSHQLFFVSNIWNFSSPGGAIDPTDFYQIGPNATVVAPEYYYGLGGPITITYPFTLNLFLNSTLVGGRDAVYFNFTLQNGTEFFAGSYDHAIFNSTVTGGPAAPAPAYIASGSTYNPLGLTNDFEMVLGGPGGGSNFDVLNSQAYFGLQFWNTSSDQYSTVPSAYGFGSETGETAVGAYVLWGSPGFSGIGNPSAYLAPGPSFLQGLWNVSSAPVAVGTYGGFLTLTLAPSNGFVFIAPGSVFTGWYSTNWSLFQWAPYSASVDEYELDPGTYTIVAILANYDPAEVTINIPGTFTFTTQAITLAFDAAQGVYTPLWAFDNSDLYNISNYDGTNYVLFNQQYAPIGAAANFGVTFPWFGLANDYLFPVFPGIMLWNTTQSVDILSPPSLKVNYPAPLAAELASSGLPTWNDLQMFFYDDRSVDLLQGAQIGGWWYSGAYFGPATSAYNVVFWNTTGSEVYGNTFDTGGNSLYFYGGTDNLILNNTFEQTVPISADPFATVAGAYGSTGIFEADYGNATDVAAHQGVANETYLCFVGYGFCDLIFNNIFLTTFTADSPLFDPYYFYLAYPTCPAWLGVPYVNCYFNEAWNIGPLISGELGWPANIIGGPQLGGNYWWDYGSYNNPYSQLPYISNNFQSYISWGGDYLPLTLVSLYTVSFVETGLPAGTYWEVGADIGGVYQYVESNSNTVNLTAPSGSFTYSLYAFSPDYGGQGGTFIVNDQAIVVHVVFVKAYTIEFTETGLPTGATWWAYVYNFTTDAYLGFTESSSSTANFTGVLPAEYTWEPGTDAAWWSPSPSQGTVVVAANTSVAVHFVSIYTLTVTESGLPAGTAWTLLVWNANVTDAGGSSTTTQSFNGLPGTYHWAAISAGFEANPNQGTVTISANATLNVTFAVAATLTFTETGLASGAAWTVSLVQDGVTVNETSTTSSITFTAIAGAYNYAVAATGYTPNAATGTGVLPSGTPVAVTFTAGAPATGALALTVTTAGAIATVNGAAVTLPLSQAEAPGIYAIVVSASGFVTYYNNVSVTSGQTTHVAVTLVATSSSSGTSSTNGISTTGWILIALLGVLAVVFLITTVLMSRRGRAPPAMTAYTAPPPTATADPAGTPAWSEGPSPPSPPPGAI
ncbi:MAG: thermopsin family protease [Thermoplasmata archaeon]|nr:thermopsin family protease [Thermoplasmata archaeon]